ncbi:GNAT family N-acetyltransferase [Thalassotalea fonticola]|uniref:GNAT family N-acetyltransferase n=1 Tax=Thalassotalea fonticola TaxID=3065649 RepID=A0ABZ0GLF7_9GAMM|nr:GNAT family N-acetyltransferase [Colwelliaceae bacterium S1-1]
MVTIRKYQSGDELALREIFFNTIRNVNIKDYSEAQVKAWAPDDYSLNEWSKRISSINPFVACINDEVVGYADIQDDGYVDHFFCHWQHQGKGIGKALMKSLKREGERKGIKRFYSHVSITARPFFEHFGFRVVKEQQVNTRDQTLTNFVMEKFS